MAGRDTQTSSEGARANTILAVLSIAGLLSLVFKLLIAGKAISLEQFSGAHAPIASTIGIVVLMLIPLAWASNVWRFWAALALNGVITFVVLVDLWHFRFYGDVPSLSR